MKVFIVFFALLIINVSFLTYQGDMGRYVRCQAFLKAVAEECAAGAALYYDEEAYSDGRFCFRQEEGLRYIEFILQESDKQMLLPHGSTIAYEVLFQDDVEGYEDDSGSGPAGVGPDGESDSPNPSVTVELKAATGDLFRLPFLTVTEIKRKAKYELPW